MLTKKNQLGYIFSCSKGIKSSTIIRLFLPEKSRIIRPYIIHKGSDERLVKTRLSCKALKFNGVSEAILQIEELTSLG